MVQQISAFSSRSAGSSSEGRLGRAGWMRASLARFTGRVRKPVDLLDQRFSFLPRSFVWRGGLWR